MKEFEYKKSFYSLNTCKEFVRNMAGNMSYSEDERMLTACFSYLEEYENKLKKEYVESLPILFKVRCKEEEGNEVLFSNITKNKIYHVVEELENEYLLKTGYGDLISIDKTKFDKII